MSTCTSVVFISNANKVQAIRGEIRILEQQLPCAKLRKGC